MEKLYSRPSFTATNGTSSEHHCSCSQPFLNKCECYCEKPILNKFGKPSERNKFRVQLKGNQGLTGADGLSAYQLAVNAGFVGTLEEWLDSLEPPTLEELPDYVAKLLDDEKQEETTS